MAEVVSTIGIAQGYNFVIIGLCLGVKDIAAEVSRHPVTLVIVKLEHGAAPEPTGWQISFCRDRLRRPPSSGRPTYPKGSICGVDITERPRWRPEWHR